MLDDRYKKIFAENLKYYMKLHNKNQADLINDLGFNKSSVSTWCNGTRLPRMDKVDILAKYFDINRSDLIEDKDTEHKPSYYLNPETSRIAQKIYDNKELSVLFDAAQDAEPEDLQALHGMLMALKRKEKGN
ncbi:MAG: helix-turn-helix domain-containing protein [Butyribacter sp.]|jgi:transcriptional regulator with XRE-family HTH domain|uniref:helix-turn-helix domain-containing protein n=1 Tax=Butyribacter intestini TaxID=1703332 RepID=UPI003A2B5EC5